MLSSLLKVRSYIRLGRIIKAMVIIGIWFFISYRWINTVWRLSSPFPYADDFNSCLRFTSDWIENRAVFSIFETYNEAPNTLLRLAVLASYYTLGTVSFDNLALLASFTPIAFAALCAWLIYRLPGTTWSHAAVLAMPIALLMTQPATWGSYFWASSAYTHGVLPFVSLFIAILFDRQLKISALILSLAAALIGGSGFFILGFTLVCLITNKANVDKEKLLRRKLGSIEGSNLLTLIPKARRNLILFPLFFICLSYVCFGSNRLLLGRIEDFLSQDDNTLGPLFYALAFIGNGVNSHDAFIALLLGCAILGILVVSRCWRSMPVIGVVTLTCLAAMSSALLRFPSGGVDHALLSRYQPYSTALMSVTYMHLLSHYHFRRALICAIAMVCAGYFWTVSHNRIPAVISNFNLQQARQMVAQRFDRSVVIGDFPPRSATDRVLCRASRDGSYHLKNSAFTESHIEQNVELPSNSAKLIFELSAFQRDNDYVYIRGFITIKAEQFVLPQRVCLLSAEIGSPGINSRLCLPAVRGNDLKSSIHTNISDLDTEKKVEFALFLPNYLTDTEKRELFLMASGHRSWHITKLGKPEVNQSWSPCKSDQ